MMKALFLCAVGAACVVRGFYRPVRALVKTGSIRRCEGTNSFGVCDPSLSIVTTQGESVFSAARGVVVTVGKDYLHVVVQNEPVILLYQGIQPTAEVGETIAVGQRVGFSEGNVVFSVTQKAPEGFRLISPSGWLASRGFGVVVDNTGDKSLWCAQGRDIVVPRTVCDLKAPDRAGFALLPVTVEVE